MVRDNPFVSVVVPTRNRRELLKALVDSLCAQSYPKDRFEMIVVDNDSKDGTEEMIRQLQAIPACTLKYVRKADEGPGTSRNVGITMARGGIIAFIDDDCVADPAWIARGIDRMMEGVGVVQGKTLPNPRQEMRTFSRTMEVTRESGLYQTCNIFYRKDAIDQVGGFSAEYSGLDRFGTPKLGCEDTDLAWRVKRSGWRSAFAEDAVVYHHVFQINPVEYLFSYKVLRALVVVLPYTIKKYPEIRKTALYHRVFFSKGTAAFDLGACGVALGTGVHPAFFLLLFPFLSMAMQCAFRGRSVRTYYRGVGKGIMFILQHGIMCVLLAGGSIRNRTLLL